MNQDDCTKLDKGDIRFYDNYVPPLGVGHYILNVTQQVNPLKTGIDDWYAAGQAFSVQGPRYALPADDLLSVFPPDNGVGLFDQLLPNVVLTKPDLPWENKIFDKEDVKNQTPWIALLLFVEDDGLLLPPALPSWNPNRTVSGTLTAADFFDWSNDKPVPRTKPQNGILWPHLPVEWYESQDSLKATPCTFIDIKKEAFAKLIPCRRDLRYLTHARQVDMTAKDSTLLGVSGNGWYSVIVGNRLPDPPRDTTTPGERNIVHLVSLEGFSAYIGENVINDLPDGTERVRMIALESWSFTCLPEGGESFSELMMGLLKDDDGNLKSTSFALPLPSLTNSDPQTQYAIKAITNGYVPMRYQTRLGEETFGWYRGPFSPVPVASFINSADAWAPFDTAAAALIYDKAYGVFDLSYAVAWETGRLLALSDKKFGQELLEWQRDGHQLTDMIAERSAQAHVLGSFAPTLANSARTLLDQVTPHAATDKFMTYLLTQFADDMAHKLERPPRAPMQPLQPYADRPPPAAQPQTLNSLLQRANVQDAIRTAGAQELDEIVDDLAQWYLLKAVPFENLVPDAALLPKESIRFFYLDSNWLDVMIEGALSIGIESSRDRTYQDLMRDPIWKGMHDKVQRLRDEQLGDLAKTVPDGTTLPLDQESLSGMLLRSAVVSAWPGLEVNAYVRYTVDKDGAARPDESTLIKPLRLERLSADVLLCLWPAVPAVVSLDEPREGVAFGFENAPEGAVGDYLYLRSLKTGAGGDYGMPLCDDVQIETGQCAYQINATAEKLIGAAPFRLINVTALRSSIKTKLGVTEDIAVRDFAVQMIKVPEQAVFAYKPPSRKATDG